MDNKKVTHQVELVDMGKDDGIFPEDYVLGQSDTFTKENDGKSIS